MKWKVMIIGIIMIIISVATAITIFREFHLEERHSNVSISANDSGY